MSPSGAKDQPFGLFGADPLHLSEEMHYSL
jgi:hypothetical protein